MANDPKEAQSLHELESELWYAVIAFNATMAQLSFRIGNAIAATGDEDRPELIELRQTSRELEELIAPIANTLINQQQKKRPASILQ